MRVWFLILFSACAHCVFAQIDTFTIFINTGYVQTIDSNKLVAKAFNHSSDFVFDSQVFRFSAGDSVILRLKNDDSTSHTITIEDYASQIQIDSKEFKDISLKLSEKGAFRIYESSADYRQLYLGLSGLIVVEDKQSGHFFWNLKEFESNINVLINAGGTLDLSSYKPNYFLINGLSNPKIDEDTLAKVRGNVGDTLQVFILNSGNSVHSLHFHGYHAKVIYSNRTNEVIGWVKDTYALYNNEVVILEIVPDKPGEYPVHDHNLVAISANGIYPNGMFTTMVIAE